MKKLKRVKVSFPVTVEIIEGVNYKPIKYSEDHRDLTLDEMDSDQLLSEARAILRDYINKGTNPYLASFIHTVETVDSKDEVYLGETGHIRIGGKIYEDPDWAADIRNLMI